MKRIHIMTLAALFVAGNASAIEELPESCRPKIGETALALADNAEAAQLQCDIDRAAVLSNRSEAMFGSNPEPLIHIVDTASPSGAAYIYDITDTGGTLFLDARSVPSDTDREDRIPICHLQTQLPSPVANNVAISLLSAAEADVPAYGARERMVINADGSRSYELLLNTHDIVTRIETVDGVRHFSRHADATDAIAKLNKSIIGVANFSDGWVCNTN